MAELISEICSVLKEAGVSASYDSRHDTCKVRPGDISITSDGDSLLVKNKKDTLFIVPGAKKVVKGVDLARGEQVISVHTDVGTLLFAVPSTGRKYVRVAIELDLDRDGSVDGGAYRTFQ